MRSEGRWRIQGVRNGKDLRAGLISRNLIAETEIIVITNTTHALGIS